MNILHNKMFLVLGIFAVDNYSKWVYNVPITGNGGDKKMKYPNIDAERARRGLTIERLTSMLGVTRKTYYNWCASGKIPQKKLENLAEIFGTSVDYLLQSN